LFGVSLREATTIQMNNQTTCMPPLKQAGQHQANEKKQSSATNFIYKNNQ
jgi:hypothetical protein